MSTMYGADVAQLRSLAGTFDRLADQLDEGRMAVGNAIQISAWVGPFAASFRYQWGSAHTVRIHAAAAMLRANANQVRANADAQERASAVDAGGAASGGGRVSLPASGSSAADVRKWWDSLTEEQRQRLIKDQHEKIGNLNGVPFEVRAEANRLTALDRRAEVLREIDALGDEPDPNELVLLLPILGNAEYSKEIAKQAQWRAHMAALRAELGYLDAVADGDRSLVVYDPHGDRIVEMIGTPGPDTKNVITYVPGTDANLGGFYDGSTQQVASYLVDADPSGGTVAFVYKDGPWANWDLADPSGGPRSNANSEFLFGKGQELAAFQDAVAQEPDLVDAKTTAIAHSAGMSITSASEAGAGHYDKVISLAGSFLMPGWSADPSTEYYHYQYGTDAINGLDSFTDTPHEMFPTRHQHVLPADNFFGMENPLANHGRIAEGPTTNRDALEQIYQDVHR